MNEIDNTEQKSDFAQMMTRSDGEIDLAVAALMIARMEYPNLDPEAYLLKLKNMGQAVASHLRGPGEPEKVIEALNRLFFQEEGFQGNQVDYYDPRNSFLNDVLDRKLGIPITLSIVYMEVARHAGFDLRGVGFPQHFLVKHPAPEGDIIIDPFSNGLILTKDHLIQRLQITSGGRIPFREHLLATITKRQIITRILSNLKAIYFAHGQHPQALGTIQMLLEVSPWDLDQVRDRGKVYLEMKDYPQALADLETYLTYNRDAEDAFVIQQSVSYLKGLVTREK